MQINPQLANCQVNDVEFGVYLFLFPGPRSKFSAIIVDPVAGWSSLVARWAHNPKVVGSNPAPATNKSLAGVRWFLSDGCELAVQTVRTAVEASEESADSAR